MNQDYQDEEYYRYEFDDYEDEYDYDDYYEPEKPLTRWQRLKAALRMFYLRVRNRLIPLDMDDIPF